MFMTTPRQPGHFVLCNFQWIWVKVIQDVFITPIKWQDSFFNCLFQRCIGLGAYIETDTPGFTPNNEDYIIISFFCWKRQKNMIIIIIASNYDRAIHWSLLGNVYINLLDFIVLLKTYVTIIFCHFHPCISVKEDRTSFTIC